MKILQINAVYGQGSTGTIVRDIEFLCEQYNIECFVASPDHNVLKAKKGYIIGNTLDHKLHALLSRMNGKQAYFSHIPTKKLLSWIDYIRPDIVHLHNLHSNYININMLFQYLAKKDIHTVYTFHDCWLFTGGCFHFASVGCDKWRKDCNDCPKKKFDTPAYFRKKTAQVLTDRKRYVSTIRNLTIIGASEWIANECKRSFLSNCDIRYIHNGFDLDIFKPTESNIRKQYGLEGKFIILAPASKWYSKINEETYNYFVSHMANDMKLVIFGCNTFHDNLPNNVQEIGLIHNPKEMAALYSMADVLVNCSREDTLPGINLECQATGTPVITYDATGCRETVDGINSRAIPTGDYIALYKAVEDIQTIGKSYLSENCIKWIRENFELRDSYQKYINLYKSLI